MSILDPTNTILGARTSIMRNGIFGSPDTLLSRIAAIPGPKWDPSDLTSLYSTITGGANSVVDGPVGIMLDKDSMGTQTAAGYIASQPELVTNGDFSGGTSGWSTYSANLSVSSGVMTITATGDYPELYQSIPTHPGRWYIINTELARVTSTIIVFRAETVLTAGDLFNKQLTNTSFVKDSGLFKATGTSTIVGVAGTADGAGATNTVRSFSVKEIPGQHMFAPSSAAMPILRQVAGNYELEFDGVDDALRAAFATVGPSDASWFAMMQTTDTNVAVLFDSTSQSTRRAGVIDALSASTDQAGTESGTPTIKVDDAVLIPQSRAEYHTAVADGAWHTSEISGFNASTWVSLDFGDYDTIFSYTGSLGRTMLVETANLDAAKRADILAWMKQGVGI